MKEIRKHYALALIFLLVLSGCNKLTQDEELVLNKLEDQFPDYKFEKLHDPSEAYLKVHLLEPIDSSELRTIYKRLYELKRPDSLSEQHSSVNFMYLVIYNSEGKYITTLVKNDEDIIFFEDAIH